MKHGFDGYKIVKEDGWELDDPVGIAIAEVINDRKTDSWKSTLFTLRIYFSDAVVNSIDRSFHSLYPDYDE